jgi:hypothetical protein
MKYIVLCSEEGDSSFTVVSSKALADKYVHDAMLCIKSLFVSNGHSSDCFTGGTPHVLELNKFYFCESQNKYMVVEMGKDEKYPLIDIKV